MAKDFTPYQQKVIRNYYANKEAIQGQALADLVSDLYLAGTEKKKASLWTRARSLMSGLGVADAVSNAIVEKRNLAALAQVAAKGFAPDKKTEWKRDERESRRSE
jgi:hypothetical protein